MKKELDFRYAERKDTPLILAFIKALAEYEEMLDEVVADEKTLEEWIFDKKKAEVLFAMSDGKEIGFALFVHNFSTFWDVREFIWRICLYCRNIGEKDMEKRF